ncbi:hypothetical protein KGF56_004900 [Candida oxycetoniae]|uniref:VPS4-associated protein 1 n=1 Tax=Candida oxycetoniae TaxID=497107 RepID=A0AAI9WVP9_9ASCO|nr:uncharacterized protein KGF56_004900 [Candida oxycetoniae]KAI3402330.2 hypothetical protein KGF56_004900 [Candida oxycetoniae]
MSNPPKQQLPPFPNKYTLRLVSPTDSKPCLICYKPTTSVLISENQVDFFYTCNAHLLDTQFTDPVHPQAYYDLAKEIEVLKQSVEKLKVEVDSEKPYFWGLNQYWKNGGGSGSTESKSESTSKNGNDDDGNKEKSTNKTPASKDVSKYELLKSKLKEQSNSLQEKETQLQQFKFKNYTLHQTIYRNRLMAFQKRKYNKERSEKIQQKGFFPSAPTHDIS